MILEATALSKCYGKQKAVDRLDLEAINTHCLALIGPSGGGKSTTLRLLSGLEVPDNGAIRINGQSLGTDEGALRAYRKSIGIVFQAFNLFPHLDAVSNITLPLIQAHGIDREQATERAHVLLKRLQLGQHSHKKPFELSGGQNQRVAIARAIGHDPKLVFFDEPTSALDPEMTSEVLDVINEMIHEKRDVVIATHEMGFARKAADHVAMIADGRTVECASSSKIFENPESEATERFLSKILKY